MSLRSCVGSGVAILERFFTISSSSRPGKKRTPALHCSFKGQLTANKSNRSLTTLQATLLLLFVDPKHDLQTSNTVNEHQNALKIKETEILLQTLPEIQSLLGSWASSWRRRSPSQVLTCCDGTENTAKSAQFRKKDKHKERTTG